jgi:flavodoxin
MVKFMMIRYHVKFLITLLFSCFSLVIKAESQTFTEQDVLIIYSSGFPYASISEIDTLAIDDLSTPTPKLINCETIAQKLFSLLNEKELKVEIMEASEVNHWKEILEPKVVILGTPTYFYNVSWEMKKLMDEKFGQIYIYHKGDKIKPKFYMFTMAEIESSAVQTIAKIKQVLDDCRLDKGDELILLTKYSVKDVEWRISKFTDEIHEQIKSEN